MEDQMFQTKQHDILKIRFNLIAYEIVMKTIERWREAGRRRYVAITNPHSVLLCHRDEQMFRATLEAGMVLPDGVGILLAARLLGYRHYGRATGPTLMLKLCDWGRKNGYRHFFYGGAEGVAARLAANLSNEFPGLKVAGACFPPFRPLTDEEDRSMVEKINSAKPDIVWVGLGAPKQEKWMADHLGRIKATVMIGVGAAFDFHSGNIKWAPALIRRLGLEWAYRLAQNPKRMWRRNLDSPLFLSKVMGQRLSNILRRESQAVH
ncbi:MAG: glycosyltransferase [Planctomycetes bacterium B3_Pla]|nr:MAG: glycosyltransferase [Planctomycetes bacterium B3_Pla]